MLHATIWSISKTIMLSVRDHTEQSTYSIIQLTYIFSKGKTIWISRKGNSLWWEKIRTMFVSSLERMSIESKGVYESFLEWCVAKVRLVLNVSICLNNSYFSAIQTEEKN